MAECRTDELEGSSHQENVRIHGHVTHMCIHAYVLTFASCIQTLFLVLSYVCGCSFINFVHMCVCVHVLYVCTYIRTNVLPKHLGRVDLCVCSLVICH